MKHLNKLLISIFAAALSAAAFGQGTTQPVQPADPTAQSPTGPIPSTPPTFPTPEVKGGGASGTKTTSSTTTGSGSQQGKLRPFLGMIVQSQEGYALRSGDLEYRLDDQSQAKEYDGKNVKVTGSLDKKNNRIQVKRIELAPAS
jgi:hypothetical protein